MPRITSHNVLNMVLKVRINIILLQCVNKCKRKRRRPGIRRPTCRYNSEVFERQAVLAEYFSHSWSMEKLYILRRDKIALTSETRLRQTARTDFGFRRIHRTRTNIGFSSKASSPRILWKYFLLLLGDFLFNARSISFCLLLFSLLSLISRTLLDLPL